MSKNFPISAEDDSFVTRREFTKFLGLTSIAFFAGTFVAAGRKLWKRAMAGRSAALRVSALLPMPKAAQAGRLSIRSSRAA